MYSVGISYQNTKVKKTEFIWISLCKWLYSNNRNTIFVRIV